MQIRNLALGMNCMASFYCNIAFMLLISGRAFALEMPSINLPQGYSTSFRSVHNTLHLRAPTSPPKLPAKGAVATGVYRNMFVEYGLPKESVQARVNQVGVYSIAFVRHQGPRTWLHRPCLQWGKRHKIPSPLFIPVRFYFTTMPHARSSSSCFSATLTPSPCTSRARTAAGRTCRTSGTTTCAARECRKCIQKRMGIFPSQYHSPCGHVIAVYPTLPVPLRVMPGVMSE